VIYQFTGQPGHGKTLHALLQALEFKDQGRVVYACNVRDLDYERSGLLPMTPEQFRDWPNWLPDGAVALVDECYEHDMLPKLGPGVKVPHHVEQLAKHRHRGIDFIFVCQSPSKQMHTFVHDLIEQHTHVRRRFGMNFVHLRIFDRYESRPEKAHPLIDGDMKKVGSMGEAGNPGTAP
jgi:zona occludens toxin (predicted ATPase)